jgi:O-antigen ligase
MKSWLKNLKKAKLTRSEIYALLLPVALWFSYYPGVHFGEIAGANIELSIILIYLSGFVLIHLSRIVKNYKALAQNKAVLLIGVLVAWSAISLLWTSNLPRGLLTLAVILLLYGSMLAFLSMKRFKILLPQLAKVYVISAVVVALVSIAQVIYGAWTDWGICGTCGSAAFGFVRPGFFAIEPQFLGSLMIAPIFILCWQFLKNKFSWLLTFALVVTSTALYLTLSRGAIYAFIIGLVIMVAMNWRRYKKLAGLFGLLIVSIFIGITIHATATELTPKYSDGFYDSVSKSVSHMSMGIIELPRTESYAEPNDTDSSQRSSAIFDGYVERSTDERTGMFSLSLNTWSQNLNTILFGVGLGGTGVSINEYTGQTSSYAEITQNQYAENLLELGLVGLALFVFSIAALIHKSRQNSLFVAIIVAYLVQWNMFSGYPNALHVYLVLIAIYCYIHLGSSIASAKHPRKLLR